MATTMATAASTMAGTEEKRETSNAPTLASETEHNATLGAPAVESEKDKVADAEAGLSGPTATKQAADFSAPDGGLEAWSVVAGGWLALFATFGYVNAFGIYQDYYVRELGQSPSAISWIGSFQLWLQFSMGLITGRLFDEGHGRILIHIGSIIYVFGLFMTSLCKTYWQLFLAQGITVGLGIGTIFLPSVSIIPQWFQRRRAFATGIVISGSSIGGICFPIMLNNLIPRIGYANAVRASAYLVLGCLVVANFLIKPRIPGRKHRPAHMQFPAPNVKAIITHKAYLVTVAGSFLIMWGIFFPLFYLQVFAESHGISPQLSFYLLAIANGASAFGRILPNFVADKLGVFNMLIASSAVSGVIIFCWLPATNTAGVIVIALLFGFSSGAYVSLIPGVFQSLSSHMGEMGVRLGLAWAVVALAALTGTPIEGALLGDKIFTWWRPTVWAGITTLSGSALLFVARGMHAKALGKSRI